MRITLVVWLKMLKVTKDLLTWDFVVQSMDVSTFVLPTFRSKVQILRSYLPTSSSTRGSSTQSGYFIRKM